jgi:outer membrane murein-binding lipoprotein Lpp
MTELLLAAFGTFLVAAIALVTLLVAATRNENKQEQAANVRLLRARLAAISRQRHDIYND